MLIKSLSYGTGSGAEETGEGRRNISAPKIPGILSDGQLWRTPRLARGENKTSVADSK